MIKYNCISWLRSTHIYLAALAVVSIILIYPLIYHNACLMGTGGLQSAPWVRFPRPSPDPREADSRTQQGNRNSTSVNKSCGLDTIASFSHIRETYTSENVWDYCWMNWRHFVNFSSSDAKVSIFGFDNNVESCKPVVWRLETGQGHGGDIFQAWVMGPALINPDVLDMRNGTYFVFFVPVDAGRYSVSVTLRWKACSGYVFCSSEDIQQPISKVLMEGLDVVESSCCHIAGADSLKEQARWIRPTKQQRQALHPLVRGEHIWSPFVQPSQATPAEIFPVSKLKGKYLYFIGDSLSEHSFNQLVDDVLRCNTSEDSRHLVSRFDGAFMSEQNKRDGMQLIHCRRLNVTLAFSFYPDYFPTGGSKETRFPLVDQDHNQIETLNNVSFGAPDWSEHLKRAMASKRDMPSHDMPSAVVFNFGLHYATPLDPPLYSILLRHQLMTLRTIFDGIPLLWRSTGYTHFEKETLPKKWNCRTPARTRIINEVSDRLVRTLGLETVDFQALSAARPDAAPDNRHYSLGNVRGTYNSLLLRKLSNIL